MNRGKLSICTRAGWKPWPSQGLRGLAPLSAALAFIAASTLTLLADAPPQPAPASAPVPATDDMTAAHQGYPAGRYEELWTHSPFSVATPDEPTTDSAEYSFVGYAQAQSGNGSTITYVSLIQKQYTRYLNVLDTIFCWKGFEGAVISRNRPYVVVHF